MPAILMTRLHPTHRGAETSRPTVSQPIGGRQDSNLRTQLKFVVPLLIPEESFRPSSRRDQRKSPAKRRTGPAFGYEGGRLTFSLHKAIPPSFTFHKAKVPCPPRARKWPRCRRGQFLPELKFIGVRKEPLFPSGTKTIRGLGNRSARFHHRIRQLCACRGPFPAHIFAAGAQKRREKLFL